jgi:hypothetical protein
MIRVRKKNVWDAKIPFANEARTSRQQPSSSLKKQQPTMEAGSGKGLMGYTLRQNLTADWMRFSTSI